MVGKQLFMFIYLFTVAQVTATGGSYTHNPATIITRHRKRVSPKCESSFITVKCFEKCEEDKQIKRILFSNHPDETVFEHDDKLHERALEIERGDGSGAFSASPGAAYPCMNKCETDPDYWVCIAECDDTDHTKSWGQCFSKDGGQPACGSGSTSNNQSSSPFPLSSSCTNCMLNSTKEHLLQSCKKFIADGYETLQQCESLSDCSDTTELGPGIESVFNLCLETNGKDLKKIRNCVNDLVMESKRKCCYNGTFCEENPYECDQMCLKVLSPHLCHKRCRDVFQDQIILNCTENCNATYPTVKEVACSDCEKKIEKLNWTCGIECNSTVECAKSCLDQYPDGKSLLEKHCLKTDYFRRLVKLGKSQYPEWDSFKIKGFYWLSKHFTPFECPENGTEGMDCEDFVNTIRTFEEIQGKCEENPYRIVDVLAYSLDQQLIDLSLKGVLKAFKITGKTDNGTTHLALFNLTVDMKDMLCNQYCNNDTFDKHPNHVAEMRCRIDECQEPGHSPYCNPPISLEVYQLLDFSNCRWKVDFAKADSPYYLWAHYFNELGPLEITHTLKSPNTINILERVTYSKEREFYTFPYFIVVRGACEDNLYVDQAYRYFMVGGSPVIETQYVPPTSRHQPASSVIGIFEAALIRLHRRAKNDTIIPENPRSFNGSNKRGCHADICYPAFAVPLMFFHIPIFDVAVYSQEIYTDKIQTVHVSAFHSRTIHGKGEIIIDGKDYPAHAAMLFPKVRSTIEEDTELSHHSDCYSNNATETKDLYNRTCPELEHFLDDANVPYDKNRFAPLDSDDIFRCQYTWGTSPTQAIGGFFDPKFLIIGDADFENFEIVDWSTLLADLEGKPNFHSCIQPVFKNQGYEKPIYSFLDKSDGTYPINYYRQRFAAKPYVTQVNDAVNQNEKNYADTAIFEAIGLEDRLLLVTSKGLVSFYGHTYATASVDKTWSYSDSEIVNRCFKIVRVPLKAQPFADTIVGVTYNYKTKNYTEDGEDPKDIEIHQEVWLGNYTTPGKDIAWVQLRSGLRKSSNYDADEIEAYRNNANNLSTTEFQEQNAKSEVESICFKAFRTKIQISTDYASLPFNETGWCEALDATQVQLESFTVQLLVRLKIYVTDPNETNTVSLYFYIVASSLIDQLNDEVSWNIDTLIPRIPCVYVHRESVTNVLPFDEDYFKYGGCIQSSAEYIKHHIYIHGMTYTRTLSNHLFLYGSRLLQSSNKGESFLYIRGFPKHLQSYDSSTEKDPDRYRHVHRIIKMAFDDGGHYAFLTNKLELWLGSTGTLTQIRLRPSPLWSLIQLGVSKVQNVNDGVPFSVNYDSANRLYEMVAILGNDGHVSRIMKRPINEWRLLRFQTLARKFKEYSEILVSKRKAAKELTTDMQKPFYFDPLEWSTFCHYASPHLTQNYTERGTKTQGMIFPHPKQHLLMGIPHLEGSLMSFQAATFSLVWKTFYSRPNRLYAGLDGDPFKDWVERKKTAGVLSMLRFTSGNPKLENAVLVEPRKYRRLLLETRYTNIVKYYYLDFGLVTEITLEFSINNEFMLLNTNFDNDEIKQVELNVENANGSIIQIDTDKEIKAQKAAVVFTIVMSVNKKCGLPQNKPGVNLFPVPVTYHLIGAYGKCLKSRANGILGDSIQTVAMVGCPASRDFVFDWQNTLKSIKFRGDKEGRPRLQHGIGSHCFNGTFICFFARAAMTPFFKIFDESQQMFIPYEGKYTMRLIGGGRDRHNMRMYTEDEIEAYNIPGVSDVSLIWNEWDPAEHHKIDRKPEILYDSVGNEVIRDSREIVLESGKTTILWACHTFSPCARIAPTKSFEVVFWFKVQISNRLVDNETLCIYEKEFDMQLYGFPPSPETQLVMTLGFSFLFLSILYILFICCRKHKRVWIETKTTTKTWFYIVKDAIPKKLRFYEPPLPPDDVILAKHRKKKVSVFQGETDPDQANSTTSVDESREDSFLKRGLSSSSTMLGSQSSLILHGRGGGVHSAASSVKETVYDQILTKRLHTIVEKNRAMQNNLLKKASIHTTRDEIENEEHFEKQFGRTVSQESVFTPPMPKDKSGFDIFF